MTLRGVSFALIATFSASTSMAKPIMLGFTGEYLGSHYDTSAEQSVASAFAIGAKVSGRIVYNSGTPLITEATTPLPGNQSVAKRAAGPAAVLGGEVTVGQGPGATTIRYEGANPSMTPYLADYFARLDPAVKVFSVASSTGYRDEVVNFSLGGFNYNYPGQGYSGIFSETNDRTGALQPTSIVVGATNYGFAHTFQPAFDPTGVADLDVLPTDFAEHFAASEISFLYLTFVSPTARGSLQFALTDVSFTPLAAEDVPEPGALGLLGLLGLGLAALGARRKWFHRA